MPAQCQSPSNEPAAVDPAQTTSRSTRSSSQTTAPQEQPRGEPSRLNRRTTRTVQDSLEPEQGRSFAPLTSLESHQTLPAGSRSCTVTPLAPPFPAQQPQTASPQIYLSPTRAELHTQPPFPPRTPGHVAANHLHSRLNAQTLMASPGPPLRNPSDDKSEQDNEDFENLGISLDSDEERSPPPRVPALIEGAFLLFNLSPGSTRLLHNSSGVILVMPMISGMDTTLTGTVLPRQKTLF
ncbi:hypothetical protein K438DRAFT_1765455 [Mycena galopus ATCC 62051]|nr:hypothetical protein K438DRAFT_1765455 [Mycena galopus ATCC 62051]